MSFTTVTFEKALLLIRVTCMYICICICIYIYIYIYIYCGATVPGGPGPLQHSQETSLLPGGIRTWNPRKWPAADLRLKPRDHWVWHLTPVDLMHRIWTRSDTKCLKCGWESIYARRKSMAVALLIFLKLIAACWNDMEIWNTKFYPNRLTD